MGIEEQLNFELRDSFAGRPIRIRAYKTFDLDWHDGGPGSNQWELAAAIRAMAGQGDEPLRLMLHQQLKEGFGFSEGMGYLHLRLPAIFAGIKLGIDDASELFRRAWPVIMMGLTTGKIEDTVTYGYKVPRGARTDYRVRGADCGNGRRWALPGPRMGTINGEAIGALLHLIYPDTYSMPKVGSKWMHEYKAGLAWFAATHIVGPLKRLVSTGTAGSLVLQQPIHVVEGRRYRTMWIPGLKSFDNFIHCVHIGNTLRAFGSPQVSKKEGIFGFYPGVPGTYPGKVLEVETGRFQAYCRIKSNAKDAPVELLEWSAPVRGRATRIVGMGPQGSGPPNPVPRPKQTYTAYHQEAVPAISENHARAVYRAYYLRSSNGVTTEVIRKGPKASGAKHWYLVRASLEAETPERARQELLRRLIPGQEVHA